VKKKLSTNNIKGMIVILGVIIIPLLYSYFYLGAFWDPYSRLETLPVAVVNNDQGATINDEDHNIGEVMCKKLEKDGTLKFIFTDEEDAKTGTKGEKYYAMIVIPQNFSSNIASASSANKQTATIVYSPNEKRNYLASQILSRAVLEIEETTRSSVNKEIVEELTNKLKSVPDQMSELQDGLNQLNDGSTQLSEGTNKLADGITTFNTKFTEYGKGVLGIKEGSAVLNNGVKALDRGINKLTEGVNKISTSTANIGVLSTGAENLALGATTFNESLIQYTTGVDSLITSANSTSNFLKEYVAKVNPSIMKDPVFAAFITKMSASDNTKNLQTLQAATTQLKAASGQIATGASQLAEGTSKLPQLKSAINQLSEGLTQTEAGATKLAEGSQSLYTGINTINDATTQLGKATKDIYKGATSLEKGSNDINEGIETAKIGIGTSITDTDEDLKVLDGLADFAAEPVSIEQKNVTSVPNYGTAFAPYFLSLSLWVGALIIFFGIYLDSDGKFKILSRNSENKVARSFIYLLIGFTQAVVLGIVVKFGLGLKVDNLALYFISCCLVSMVFISIVQFFLVHLKDLGKFLAIAFLILQLTSCGGTFPMETVPKLFNILYPFMPMTYSVGLFKQAISGVDTTDVVFNGGILSIMLIVFMTLTILFSVIKTKKPSENNSIIE